MAHAGVAIVADDVVDFVSRRGDAGEMRGRRQRGLREDALDGGMRTLAGRAAGAVGDRDEQRIERREPRDRLPQRALHLVGLRREELERNADAALVGRMDESARAFTTHHATSRVARLRDDHARISSEPQRHRDLAVRRGIGCQIALQGDVETRGLHPLRHRLGREAEAAMGMLVAQEFEIVRREVDHQQPPAGPQHACRLMDRPGRRRRGSAAPGG